MSCIYFHSPSETLAVSGRERAHMGVMINYLGLAPLLNELKYFGEQPVECIFSRDTLHTYHGARPEYSLRTLETHLSVEQGDHFTTDDNTKTEIFVAVLNTILTIGAPHMALFAKLHG